jgi:pumilio family protein 6
MDPDSLLSCPVLPCACRSVVADVIDTMAATGGNALKLVHTHDGAAAAAMALAYGTPKDRKRLVKGMKGKHPANAATLQPARAAGCGLCSSQQLCRVL